MRNYIVSGGLLVALAVTPSTVVGQSAAPAGGCAAAVEPVTSSLQETATRATALVEEIAATDAKLTTYYQSVALPAGRGVPNYAALQAEVAKSKQAAETQIAQLPALQLRCQPTPAASVNFFNKEVGEALAAVRGYRAAVRTELLTIRTRAIQGSTPAPGADDRTEP